MNAPRIDRWTRSFSAAPSRRGLPRGLSGAALGLAAARVSSPVEGRKRRRNGARFTTTGNAGFRGRSLDAVCTGCTRNTECEPTHGAGASRVLRGHCPDTGTLRVAAYI